MSQRDEVVCPCGGHWTWGQLIRGECDAFPAPLALALKQQRYSDVRHREPGLVTTSTVLGCPRASALSRLRAEPVIVGRMVNMSVGTAVHEWLAGQQVPGWVTERCSCPAPLPVSPGELPSVEGASNVVCRGGECHEQTCGRLECTFEAEVEHRGQVVRMSGRTDALVLLDDEGVLLVDWKVRNPNARRYVDDARRKDAVQQLLTMELARRQGLKVAGAQGWTCYLYEWRKQEYAPLSGEEFDAWLDTRLPDDERTVWQAILEQHDAAHVTSVDEALELPARGTRMFGGRMCKTYCPYQRVCFPDELGI